MYEEICLIVAINLALYLKTLRHKFVSDDFTVWKNPPAFKNRWAKLWGTFMGTCKHQRWSHSIVNYEGKWYYTKIKTEEMEHLLSLVIHTLIGIAIFFAFGKDQIAFIAALLYTTNPFNNQATIWPGGRGYALPILSLVTAIAVPYSAPVMLYFCSSFTIGFLAPLALIGSPVWYLLAIMPFVWLLHSKKFKTAVGNKIRTETYAEDKKIHPRRLIMGIKTYGFYLVHCLVPFRVTFYHNFLQSAAGSMKHKNYTLCRYFWIGFIAASAWLAYAIMVPWNSLTWAFFAFSISIAPFTNIIRANQEIAERFSALANVFLMYWLAQIITPYPMIALAWIVFYATRTYYTVDLYKDEYAITERAVIEDPHAWWAWHCRAMKRWDTQSHREALLLWVMAKLISPREFKVLMNIATALRVLGNHKEADEYLKMAEENIIEGQEKEAAEFIAQHRAGRLPIIL